MTLAGVKILCEGIRIGKPPCSICGEACKETPPSSLSWVKGGENVRTLIKLLEVLTNLIRAITELIRETKR